MHLHPQNEAISGASSLSIPDDYFRVYDSDESGSLTDIEDDSRAFRDVYHQNKTFWAFRYRLQPFLRNQYRIDTEDISQHLGLLENLTDIDPESIHETRICAVLRAFIDLSWALGEDELGLKRRSEALLVILEELVQLDNDRWIEGTRRCNRACLCGLLAVEDPIILNTSGDHDHRITKVTLRHKQPRSFPIRDVNEQQDDQGGSCISSIDHSQAQLISKVENEVEQHGSTVGFSTISADDSQNQSNTAPRDADIDSYFADTDDVSSTSSLDESDFEFEQENGRTYHCHTAGLYPFPNDETEMDHLDFAHHLYRLAMNNRLHMAPLGKNIHSCLDIGTGTGLWLIEFADMYPSAVCTGMDLSPTQPIFVPPNVEFIVDNAAEDWIFRLQYDFVHARNIRGSVSEEHMLTQAFKYLRGRGLFERTEMVPWRVRFYDENRAPAILEWSRLMDIAIGGKGQVDPKAYVAAMEAAGFVEVIHKSFLIPCNRWARGKYYKTLGLWNCENIITGLEGLTMALFTRQLGWERDRVTAFLVDVRTQFRDVRFRSYMTMDVIYGKKPE